MPKVRDIKPVVESDADDRAFTRMYAGRHVDHESMNRTRSGRRAKLFHRLRVASDAYARTLRSIRK